MIKIKHFYNINLNIKGKQRRIYSLKKYKK